MTIRNRTFLSGISVMISTFSVQLLKVASAVVLARLLEPGDFGIVSLAAVLVGATELFSGVGMGSAVIASKEESAKSGFHAVCITVASGLFFMILIVGFAPTIAHWFGKDQLHPVIRWMSILIFLQTLTIVPVAILMKEMMFGRLIIPRTAAALSSMGVGVAMALSGYGYWSLVGGQIAGGVVALASSTALCPNLNWLKPQKWDHSLAKGMGRFGLTNMGTGIVQYIYNEGDYVIVGKSLGTTVLGFYTQAYNLANLPVDTTSAVANSVLFPAYAKIRDDADRLSAAFLESFRMVSVISIPMALGLLIMAPDMVIFLIGEKWRSSIPILQVFSVLSLVRPLSGTTSPLFLAINRPDFNLRTAIIQCLSMFSLIFIFLPWGAPGVALGVVSAFVVGIACNIYLACRRTGLPIRLRDLLRRVTTPVLASVFMIIVVVIARRPMVVLAGGTHNVFTLAGLVLAGILSYSLMLLVIDRRVVLDIVDLIVSALRPKLVREEISRTVNTVPADGEREK